MARKSKAKVVENPDLIRDLSTNAIINTNVNSFAARKMQLKVIKEKENNEQCLKQEVEYLKSGLKQLKAIVNKIIN